MRCRACDSILTEAEDRRLFVGSRQRVELCAPCAEWIDVPMTPLKKDADDTEDADSAEIEV